MAVALHDRDPDQVYMVARRGEVFGTADGGKTWQDMKLPPVCKDLYALGCG